MASWSSLIPDVVPFVPGCPDPMIEQEIRSAAIEFFQRTRAWVEWLEPFQSQPGAIDYDLDLPAASEVVRIERATRDGRPLDVVGFRTLMADPSLAESYGPMALTSSDRVTVTLSQPSGIGSRIQVQVSLMPTRTASGVGDTLMSKHRDAIAEGAKYRLMRMPGPMNQPASAEDARQLFERAVAACSVDAWRSHTNATPRSTPKWC